jgi:isoquinoline 1-oxidoreductase beta subunit
MTISVRADTVTASSRTEFQFDRRTLLKGSVASFVVAFTAALTEREALAAGNNMVGAYIRIEADPKNAQGNIVTVCVGASEMGQGIMSGLAQLVAEELKIPWTQVRTEHAVLAPDPANSPNLYANPMFHAQLTGGSTSMRGWFDPLRQAAAIAREQLRTAAAQFFNVAPSVVTMANGLATVGSTSYPYSKFVAVASGLGLPSPLPVPSTSYSVIGQRVARPDLPAKVDGSAVFGIDVQVPGMVYAAVKHCPVLGGTVAAMPAVPAGAIAVVNLTNAVAVVANDTWSAMRLAQQLNVKWTIPTSSAAIDTASILATSKALLDSTTVVPQVFGATPNADSALSQSANTINQVYQLPHVAHACMEVLSSTASVTPTSCEIWAPTQGQSINIATAAKLCNIAPSQVKVHTTFLGGGLGRKFEQDFVAQSVLISKAVGKPVKLTWSRTQDFQNDKYRPNAVIRVQLGADASGALTSLIYRNVGASIAKQNGSTNPDGGAVAGVTDLKYTIPEKRVEFVPNNVGVPLGYWRSVGESYNIFALESAIDEMAVKLGKDPLAYRRSLVTDTAPLAVLDAVAALSGWSSAPPKGRARGVAYMYGFGSHIAMVSEISLDASGRIVVNKVSVAIDCGTAVNPDSVEAQMQSGIVHGLGATLWGEVVFTAGSAKVSNFSNYRVMKLREMPTVAVKIVSTGGKVGGVGETAVPVVAPSVLNAYAKLTGTRLRTLPLYPGSTMSEA